MLAYETFESKDIYQHAHMRRLIIALAIKKAVLFFSSDLCVATAYVRLFIVPLRTIKEKKFVSYYLFTMCKFQLISTNKNMKN